VSKRFVITWSLFACLWAAWVLSASPSLDRIAPLFAQTPPFPDIQTIDQGSSGDALTAYALHSIERNAALRELLALAAGAFGIPLAIVVLLVIADMGAPRVGVMPGRHGSRQVWVSVSGPRAVRIALLFWLVLSALWFANLSLRLGPSNILSSPRDALCPPVAALMTGLFLYGISLPVRDRG
jgi:hypothetical protein